MNNRVKINDAVNSHFICCKNWLMPRKVQPKFHTPTVIALSAANLLNTGPSWSADISHDSPKAIISRNCHLGQILPHPS
jgi:hypothetical protein